MPPLSRRTFLRSTMASGALATAAARAAEEQAPTLRLGKGGPIVIASGNGCRPDGTGTVATAMDLLRQGADPLDAAIAGVNLVEDDPDDHSVGYGGLPNEDGVVELDASVMHGPTHRAGGVAAIRHIKNPSKVAKLVMQRSDHVLIVGEGALRFAKAHGFAEENLLTDEARRIWLDWKERHSETDDWLPPTSQPTTARAASTDWRAHFSYGTINCLTLDARGNLAGVTTTSGLSFKIPGRVGDSPIIGAGLYVDNSVGAAGSTGRGEANLQNCSSYALVELMRAGMEPREACIEQLTRIAKRSEPRLLDARRRPTFDLTFYALRKDGLFASASYRPGSFFAVHDGTTARRVECAAVFRS